MVFHDITSGLNEGHPIWPGDPSVKFDWISKLESGDESNITTLQMSVHTATHIDAPLHFLYNGKTVDQLEIRELIGEAAVIRIPDQVDVISAEVLDQCEIGSHARVLFKTRNSTLELLKQSEFCADYVALDASGSQWLVDHGVRLVGIDYLSIAAYRETVAPHRILLEAGAIVVEGLDLTGVEAGVYKLICLPLKLIGREGAPARVILEEREN